MITELLSGIGLIILIIYFGSLFRVMLYEKGINRLHKELKSKIDIERKRPAVTSYVEGAIRVLKEKYQPQIEELERRRRFILEKLPFIKN